MSELTAFVLAAGAGKAGVVVSAFLASAVEFVEALPRTTTGKVQRFRLREAAS